MTFRHLTQMHIVPSRLISYRPDELDTQSTIREITERTDYTTSMMLKIYYAGNNHSWDIFALPWERFASELSREELFAKLHAVTKKLHERIRVAKKRVRRTRFEDMICLKRFLSALPNLLSSEHSYSTIPFRSENFVNKRHKKIKSISFQPSAKMAFHRYWIRPAEKVQKGQCNLKISSQL